MAWRFGPLRLADGFEELVEPFLVDVEGLAALDAIELDRAQTESLVLVVTDDPAFAAQRTVDSQVGAALDQAQVIDVGRSAAAEVAGLLHQRLLGPDALAELPGEVLPGVDHVELDVTEGVARDLFAVGLELSDDLFDTRALGKEDVHAVDVVHDLAQALGLRLEVDGHLRHVDRVDLVLLLVEGEARTEGLAVEHLAVLLGSGGGQPAAVPAHDLVDDEHARVGAVLGDHVGEVTRPLLSRGPGAEALPDGHHVVVDGLGQTDHRELIVVLLEVGGEVGSGGVGVVAANRVQHVDAVLGQALGGDLERILSLFDQAALEAVRDVGQLDATVAAGATAVLVQQVGLGAHIGGHLDVLALEQALVATEIADHLDLGSDLGIAFDQPGYGAGQARGQAAGGEHCDFAYGHGQPRLSSGGMRRRSLGSAARRPAKTRANPGRRSALSAARRLRPAPGPPRRWCCAAAR